MKERTETGLGLEATVSSDVPATLVYASSSRQVTDTWVAGRHVLADGTLRYIDETAVLERADAWRARIDAGDGRSNA